MPYLEADSPVTIPRAPKVVGPKVKHATRPVAEIPQYLIDEACQTVPEPWDAKKHLVFEPPAQIHSMESIGLKGHGISPNAVSDPFPLFSTEAILQMRREVFSAEVLKECRYSSDFNANMVRGMGAR